MTIGANFTEKFEAHRAASGNAEALTAVIKLLERTYAFTTHTPLTLTTPGDNLLYQSIPARFDWSD